MKYTNTILNQLLQIIPENEFKRFVGQHNADKYSKTLTCWNQLSILLFAQATGKDSLREIETSLMMRQNKWYHLGLKSVAKSTLSDANNRRPYEIFESLFYELLYKCGRLTPQKKFNFDNPLYAIDASVIKLCHSLFPWATYGKTKGAMKLHCLFNTKDQIPEFVTLTQGEPNDGRIIREQPLYISSDSIVAMDRAYIDYEWLVDEFVSKGRTYVIKTKKNHNLAVLKEHEVDELGIISDQTVAILGENAMEKYPHDVRVVKYHDKHYDTEQTYFTNNFELSAGTIAEIHKSRWQIELFFKWIKQNLKIKTFLGTSKNAVFTQIWIAMIYYLIIAFIKSQTKFKQSMLELTRMIGELILDRISIIDVLSLRESQLGIVRNRSGPQLKLF